ncbi:MAG: adenine phosphoribosyltransferase, partial [Polyangiaceae bacterium]
MATKTKKKTTPKRSAPKPAAKPTSNKTTKKTAARKGSPKPSVPRRVTLVPSQEVVAYAASHVRDIPDFPMKGIMFKDITPLLASPRAFHIVLDAIAERFIGEHIDAVVGVEARGFIFGGALAARLNASFVPARKPGKLPAASDSVEYDTEYSTATL